MGTQRALSALLRTYLDAASGQRCGGGQVRTWLERTVFGCRPSDEESAAVLKRIPPGTIFEADVVTRKHRSTAWHRRYWLLMSMLGTHCERVEIAPGAFL